MCLHFKYNETNPFFIVDKIGIFSLEITCIEFSQHAQA